MIYKVFSDLASFKEIEFRKGLNILIAEKTPSATEQQTRNRAGKTSLVDTIDFLLGSDCGTSCIFKDKAITDHYFGIELDLGEEKICLKRSGSTSKDVIIIDGDTTDWPVTTHIDKANNQYLISNTDWKRNLGSLFFSLPYNKKSTGKYRPSYRALISYILRHEKSGGFSDPHKNNSQQKKYDYQVSISFLLGLDWTIPQKLQYVRDREKTLGELKKAIGEGAFYDIIGSTSKLRTDLALSEKKTNRLKEQLTDFAILPEYHELEKEASKLTVSISKHSNENTLDMALIEQLNESIKDETPPSSQDVKRLYEEAGVILPDNVSKRFDELVLFHDQIIRNRKMYLESEIAEATERITNRDKIKESFTERKSQIMKILDSHGALDQYSRLTSELTRLETETENLRKRFDAAEQLESKKIDLDLERTNLLGQLQKNYHEQGELIRHIIVIFEEISNMLYEDAGSLEIKPTPNGPEFEIKIQGKKSAGIKNMQIFCFDIMIMQLLCEKNMSPGFLIHDSHLFDPVDERQVATALQVGAKKAEELGFQYIVTMNSDQIPSEFTGNFNVSNYILPVCLTDATENGGLFGIRF
jgi:uncharacterized protein YydD (DUF2326 family)